MTAEAVVFATAEVVTLYDRVEDSYDTGRAGCRRVEIALQCGEHTHTNPPFCCCVCPLLSIPGILEHTWYPVKNVISGGGLSHHPCDSVCYIILVPDILHTVGLP